MLTLGKCCLEVGEAKQEQVKMRKEAAVDGSCLLSFLNCVQNLNNVNNDIYLQVASQSSHLHSPTL